MAGGSKLLLSIPGPPSQGRSAHTTAAGQSAVAHQLTVLIANRCADILHCQSRPVAGSDPTIYPNYRQARATRTEHLLRVFLEPRSEGPLEGGASIASRRILLTSLSSAAV